MATVSPAIVYPSSNGANRAIIATWGLPTTATQPGGKSNTPAPLKDINGTVVVPSNWAAMASGDTAVALFVPAHVDRVVQVTGTADGATVSIQGSNDGVNYSNLRDAFGNAATGLVAGSVIQLMESTAWLLPVVVGGGGTTALNVILKARTNF